MFETPVLFLIFNRLSTTQQIFGQIRAIKPTQLFVAADGPRASIAEENEKCETVKNWVLNHIDWECDVHTLFQKENLGCGKGPATAISWFFDNVEAGIILEDDCLPTNSFFRFCETLLHKYAEDTNIHSIAGANLLPQYSPKDLSYFFSYQSGIWGWATWRRSWLLYDFQVKNWGIENKRKQFTSFFKNEAERNIYVHGLEIAFKNTDVSWWDYQFIFSRIINNSVGIIPKKNLISNIGFGEGASHTFDENSNAGFLKTEDLDFPLVHPTLPPSLNDYDQLYSDYFYKLPLHKETDVRSVTTQAKYLPLVKNVVKKIVKAFKG